MVEKTGYPIHCPASSLGWVSPFLVFVFERHSVSRELDIPRLMRMIDDIVVMVRKIGDRATTAQILTITYIALAIAAPM